MPTTSQLISEIADARKAFIDEVSVFSESDSKWKAAPETWCATEIKAFLLKKSLTEHGTKKKLYRQLPHLG